MHANLLTKYFIFSTLLKIATLHHQNVRKMQVCRFIFSSNTFFPIKITLTIKYWEILKYFLWNLYVTCLHGEDSLSALNV
jgi:hypothetical protein